MERPESIVWFERCYLGSLAASLVNSALGWNENLAKLSANPGAEALGPSFLPTMMMGGVVIVSAISLLLWYYAARRAAVVAKWIITIFFALNAVGLVYSLTTHAFPTGLAGVVAAIGFVLDAIAVWQLFRPASARWFDESRL